MTPEIRYFMALLEVYIDARIADKAPGADVSEAVHSASARDALMAALDDLLRDTSNDS